MEIIGFSILFSFPDKTIFLRQGVGSIVLQKEIHSAPGAADEVESLLISNLDQLASAAMNSVSIESMQSQEGNVESAYRKASEKAVVDMHELSLSGDSSVKQLNVKYFSEQTHFVGDSAIYSNNFARKRKSLAVENESFAGSIAESQAESGDVGNNKCSLRIFTNDNSASSPCTRQRTSSPKILCRKSKRSKIGSEKNIPDSSEPLMSSCLLLLEAATRLDNAEKTGVTSLSPKLQTGRQNLKTSPRFQCPEFSSIESEIRNDVSRLKNSTSELPKPVELQRRTRLSNCTEATRNVASFGILRTTLENADRVTGCKGNVHTFDTKPFPNDSKPAVNSSEIKIIVKEAPFATGLFSGSRIEPKASLAFILNKHESNKEDMTLPKVKLTAQKQKLTDGSCEHASVSSKIVSQTLPTVVCNASAASSGTCKKPLVSNLNTHDVCFNSSSGIKTYTVMSLPGSFGSLVVSPTPAVRNIKFTATSCHPSPVEVLPTYTQAEIAGSSESSDLHLSGYQHFTPLETDSIITSSCFLSDCSSNSTESSTLLMQDKDLFIIKPGKDGVGDIAFRIEPASVSSSVAHTDLPTEGTVPAEVLQYRKSQRLLDAGIHELPDQTWQDCSSGQSTLLRPEFLASIERKEEREDSLIYVITNEAIGPPKDVGISSGVHSETSERIKSLDTEDVVCEVKSSSCEKAPLHMPAVHSYNFQTYQGGDFVHSEVISHDSSENSLHYSSDKSLQGHTSASSSYQTLETSRNNDKPLYVAHSYSLSRAGTAVKVQSLAQLCRKYLAHLFTTLDNPASESDDNDSIAETPQCEPQAILHLENQTTCTLRATIQIKHWGGLKGPEHCLSVQ